jgi:hypothetical protein
VLATGVLRLPAGPLVQTDSAQKMYEFLVGAAFRRVALGQRRLTAGARRARKIGLSYRHESDLMTLRSRHPFSARPVVSALGKKVGGPLCFFQCAAMVGPSGSLMGALRAEGEQVLPTSTAKHRGHGTVRVHSHPGVPD